MAQLISDFPVLQAHNLYHRFGPTEVLQKINFTLKQGRVMSVVGPSGGGKTTLLHLCGGLLDVVDGEVINQFETLAFAFQDARLLPWKTAIDNISFGLKARGIGKKQCHKMATTMALRLGLNAIDLDKYPKDLSGGMRQRVAFARALVIEPQLLFLDEPFSALDIGLKRELLQLLMEWVEDKKLSIFLITHDLAEAIQLSDEILVLDADPGRVVKTLSLSRPKNERDEVYISKTMRDLLQDPQIISTFELNFASRRHSVTLDTGVSA